MISFGEFCFWLRNLPWHLTETFICDLFGHKPILDIVFVPNLTICERCMAPLKKQCDGSWSSQLALIDIRPEHSGIDLVELEKLWANDELLKVTAT